MFSFIIFCLEASTMIVLVVKEPDKRLVVTCAIGYMTGCRHPWIANQPEAALRPSGSNDHKGRRRTVIHASILLTDYPSI